MASVATIAPADEAYAGVLTQLYDRQRLGMRLGLKRMLRLMAALGHPQRAYAAIHVAGTNGKGSTSAMLATCLRQAGYRVGLYTSPHLCRFSERIRVDAQEIARAKLVNLLCRIMAMDASLTFFEIATAAAFCHFADECVDIAIVETGLGGRLDATNVTRPTVSIITSIGFDHQAILGDTLSQIATEKAGILKRCTPLVVPASLPTDAFQVIEIAAKRLDAPVFRADLAALPQQSSSLGLWGAHQRENAALCVTTLDILRQKKWEIGQHAQALGLSQTVWPGRCERIGRYLLDCAHNVDGARALAAVLSQQGRYCAIWGQMADKDAAQCIEALSPYVSRWIFTAANHPRACLPQMLQKRVVGSATAPTLADAVQLADAGDLPILIGGSVYLVGEARAHLLGDPTDPVLLSDPR